MNNGNGLITTIEIKDKQGRVVATKEVVTYAGLLNRAHQEGLQKIVTKLIQRPSKDNAMTAISMAKVVTKKGIYVECGDANPGNVISRIAPHIIRMSATRAKARALRDAVNIGVVSIEELSEEFGNGVGDEGVSAPSPNGKPKNGSPRRPVKTKQERPAPKQHDQPPPKKPTTPSGELMSEAQRRYLFRILAENGITGDEAHDFLVQTLGVESLKEATKSDASGLINQLLNNPGEMLAGAVA